MYVILDAGHAIYCIEVHAFPKISQQAMSMGALTYGWPLSS